jgi:hypothetical protein
MKKTFIGKIAKGFNFCGFRLNYDKIILAKSCLAKFEKRLSKLYEQLLKSKSSSYKNTFTTTGLLKKIELYVWRFKRRTIIVKQTVIQNCCAIKPLLLSVITFWRTHAVQPK